MAAKIDRVDQEYFDTIVKPTLARRDVRSAKRKKGFLGEALALLFPIDWPDPFGLVMIEAMARGTAVIARPCGSVPEVLKDGTSGLFSTNEDSLVEAVGRVSQLSREPYVRSSKTGLVRQQWRFVLRIDRRWSTSTVSSGGAISQDQAGSHELSNNGQVACHESPGESLADDSIRTATYGMIHTLVHVKFWFTTRFEAPEYTSTPKFTIETHGPRTQAHISSV
jgi:hypothetical protein